MCLRAAQRETVACAVSIFDRSVLPDNGAQNSTTTRQLIHQYYYLLININNSNTDVHGRENGMGITRRTTSRKPSDQTNVPSVALYIKDVVSCINATESHIVIEQ